MVIELAGRKDQPDPTSASVGLGGTTYEVAGEHLVRAIRGILIPGV
jgi:hypothetical protein